MNEPEDRRARASSIFERLRSGSSREKAEERVAEPPAATVDDTAPGDLGAGSLAPSVSEADEAGGPEAGDSEADGGAATSVDMAAERPDSPHPPSPPAELNGSPNDDRLVNQWPVVGSAPLVGSATDGSEPEDLAEAAPPPPEFLHGQEGDLDLTIDRTTEHEEPIQVSPAPARTEAGWTSGTRDWGPTEDEHEDVVAQADGDVRHPGARNHPLPRSFAIANQKGGVGKTTTAVNLGAALAELDYRVLVVDLDPQGNATTGLGINGRNLDASIYDVILHDVPIEDVIEPTTLRNLFVVPATIDLAGAEIELVPVFSRELRLKRALESVADEFDFVLIDCPPSLGLLTVNGLAAAGEVVVPIQCEYYALEGLGQLLRNVALVQANLNQDLDVSTIILTMYDARTRLAEQVVEEVRHHFGDKVCRNVVPRTVRLSEAPSFGQPIIVFDSSSRGSIAYRELAKEVSGGAPQRVR